MVRNIPRFALLFLLLIGIVNAETITYTPSSETHCNGNACNLIMYSGIRFVYEDSKWKKIEDARSLKSVWQKVYLKDDKANYDIDFTDYNYTYISGVLKVAAKTQYPLEICFANHTADITNSRSKETSVYCRNVSIAFASNQYTFSIDFSKNITKINGVAVSFPEFSAMNPLDIASWKLGTSSTIVTLNESNVGNVGDADARVDGKTTNYGTNTYMYVAYSPSPGDRGFFLGNLTVVPAGSTIINATMQININLSQSGTHSGNIQAYNTSLTNATGWMWTETALTWNNMPALDTLQEMKANASLMSFNITNAAIASYAQANQNISIVLKGEYENDTSFYNYVYTKEYSVVVKRPQLVVTYDVATYDSSFNVTWNYPVNDTWNTTTQNIKHYFTPLWNNNTIDSVSLWTNKTGTFALAVANSSAVTNNTMGYLQYDYGVDSPMIYAYFNITNTTGTSNFTANFTIKIDALPPTYSNAGVNSTSPNILDDVAFYSQWNDGITLDKYIFSWNASGVGCNTWANDTPAAFQTANWTNTTKQIPATCLGAVDEIAYMFYANDTNNHLNNTGIQLPFVFNPFFNVTWNYPANNTWNTTTQTIVHVYTPYWADSALVNCSLWMNKTGSFALEASNATPLSDNTANTITYNYAADSSQVWSYINCTNSSGSSNYTSNYTIKIDTVKPVTSATPVDGSSNPYTFTTWSNNPPITTTLSCSDATSLCLITKYCTDAPNSCTPTTTYSTPVAISSDGTTYIRYNSSDNAGNKETIASGAVMVDVGSPTTTPTATKDDSSSYTFNTWAKTTYIDVTLTGADETSGLANTKYCADTSNACTPTTTVLAPVHVATTGTSYVRYYSTDNAGNTETISSVILKIDPTAPATTATAVNNDSTSYTFGAWTTSVYVNVTLTCTDTGGSGCLVTYYCNDTDNSCTPDTEYTTPVEITTNGSSFIRYNSTDNVGNYGTIQSKHILIDPYYLPEGLIPPMSIGKWESIIGGGLGTMFGSGTYCFGGSGETCVGGVSIDMGSVLMAIFLLGFIFIWASVSGIAWDGVFFLLMIVLVILAMPVGGLLGTTAWGMYTFIWVIVIMALFYKTIFRRG